MKNIKSFTSFVLAILLATITPSLTLSAKTNANIPTNFMGRYQEVNNYLKGYLLEFNYNDDGLFLGVCGLFDLDSGYKGQPTQIRPIDNGISIDCMLHPMEGTLGLPDIPANITLTYMPAGNYEMRLTIKENIESPIDEIAGPTTMFKIGDNGIVGSVPASLPDKISIAALIKALTPYFFNAEMLSTSNFLKTRKESSDDEFVTQDEDNRFLSYAWGSNDQYMECKYWYTADNDILLVVNIHDDTYQYPQELRFFLFDRKNDSLREIPPALSPNWPINEEDNNHGIFYQVRYHTDGLQALTPQADGDSFDIVTLHFDGHIFK